MKSTIVVTGASRGIGAAIAELAAAQGHAVCLNYRSSEAEANKRAAEIQARGGKALAVQADVADPDAVERLFNQAERELGPIRGLVNNAGITGGFARLDQLEVEQLERVLATNVHGAFLCARAAVRRMSTRSGGAGGAIVNISSQAACSGGRELLHYAASKAALETFTLGLAREVAKEGIRVNAVRPGVIDTQQHADISDERRADLRDSIPLGRLGQAREVAAAVLWLLSDDASYVTGSILPVAGGR